MADRSTSKKRSHEEVEKGNHPHSRKFSACSHWKPPSEFSKSQKSIGSHRRCKDCVDASQKTQAVSQKTQAASQKKQKPMPLCCKVCQKQKKISAYPKDHAPDSPICVDCIMDSEPRECKDCCSKKTKDQFYERQWLLPYHMQGNIHSNKTTHEIQTMVKKKLTQTCRGCGKIKLEYEEKKAKEKAARDKQAMKKDNVQFYNFDFPYSHYSKTKPNNLAGIYDIIFHSGFCVGEYIENVLPKEQLLSKGKRGMMAT